MEIIHESPKTSSFISLAEHQSTTPASFYSGPPVLHYHSSRSKVVILGSDFGTSVPLTSFADAYDRAAKNGATTNGHSATATTTAGDDDSTADREIPDAEVWVTSEKLLLFSPTCSTGLSIPYPTISLHAIQSLPSDPALSENSSQQTQGQGLYMQLVSSLGGDTDEDEDMETVSLTIIPTPTPTPSTSSAPPPESTDDTPTSPQSETQALFTALSACSNLHPDPNPDSDADGPNPNLESSSLFQAGLISAGDTAGGLPPPMPGSGGWITAENMGEYVDADGNWIDREDDDDDNDNEQGDDMDEGNEDQGAEAATAHAPLGPGAGTVRTRGPDDPAGELGDTVGTSHGYGDGDGETDETKWRRTS